MEANELPIEVTTAPIRRRRRPWRLRILLGLGVLSVALLAIARLEPDQAKRCGWFVESIYRVFNPPIETELTEAGKQFIAEIAALVVAPDVSSRRLGFLGFRLPTRLSA